MNKSQLISLVREVLQETIRKVDGKYVVYPEKGGKRLGTHSTRKAAEKQLTAIHLNKEGLDEVGEASANSFTWEKASSYDTFYSYKFTSNQDLEYRVKFEADESTEIESDTTPKFTEFEVSFAVLNPRTNTWSHTSITNKGELYKVMATVVSIIKSFIEEHPEVTTISFVPTTSKDNETTDDNQRGRLYIAYIKKNIPNATITSSDLDRSISIHLNKEGTQKEIKYTTPNFEYEWEEANRYPEFVEKGKEGWVKVAKQGKPVSYSSIKNVLGNVDLDFDNLEEPKKERFKQALKDKYIEMPIAVKFSNNDYDLVAGNTRLAGLVKQGIDPPIWVVDISNLQENYADSKADLIQQFRKEAGIKQCSIYDKRDNCGPAAIDFVSWAKSKGIEGLKRINGYFKADIPVSSKIDFTRGMKQEFLNDGGNWNSDKERFDWISNSKYAEQWKYIPHYWVEDTNGKIYDPVGQQQFIDTGYAKDLNPARYTLTDIVENYADGKVKEGTGGADTAWIGADDEKITLQDILNLTKNIKVVNYPTQNLAKVVLNWDNNPEEIERISQVTVSSQYPILIMVDEQNKIQWILDGNHRAQKALRSKAETIPAKLIKPSDLDAKAKKILLGITENYADGKVKGKSRPGRVKRAGASCKGSVTDLRAKAKKYGGEKGKMYHWCANMKSSKK